MRIGNNSQGVWQLLLRMNGGKANMNIPFAGAKRSGVGGRNTLEDLLTGHYKNSYGVEGMCVTNNPNARKIIKVSDEMKQRVFNSVKDAFYKYNGMSGYEDIIHIRYSAETQKPCTPVGGNLEGGEGQHGI